MQAWWAEETSLKKTLKILQFKKLLTGIYIIFSYISPIWDNISMQGRETSTGTEREKEQAWFLLSNKWLFGDNMRKNKTAVYPVIWGSGL